MSDRPPRNVISTPRVLSDEEIASAEPPLTDEDLAAMQARALRQSGEAMLDFVLYGEDDVLRLVAEVRRLHVAGDALRAACGLAAGSLDDDEAREAHARALCEEAIAEWEAARG